MCILCQLFGKNVHERDDELKRAKDIKTEIYKLLDKEKNYIQINIAINLIAELTTIHNAPIFSIMNAIEAAIQEKTMQRITDLIEATKSKEQLDKEQKERDDKSPGILEQIPTEELKVV